MERERKKRIELYIDWPIEVTGKCRQQLALQEEGFCIVSVSY